MKTRTLSLSILLLTAFLTSKADRILPVCCLPVDTRKTVWTFRESGTSEQNEGPLYRMYGDTLLTEIFGGKRQWYAFRGDSCLYMGEESRLMKLAPAEPIPTSAFCHQLLGSVVEEKDSGIYCKTYPLTRHGTYESELPVKGELRNGDGISLRVKAVTEIRRVTEAPDSATGAEETVVFERRRTRWFCAGDTLPIAMQSEERVFVNDTPVRELTSTFIMSAEDFADTAAGNDPEDVLQKVRAVLDGDRLLLKGDLPEDMTLSVVLSDIQGMPVMETSLTTGSEWRGAPLTVPPLRPGRYILSIGTGGAVRKIFLTRN
ncbi:MAG: hypothetical protein K2G90_10075 [Muribaculaceae bacterium]|nr:hypothetical protein [Muribaculaceae bacterium]